MPLHIAWRILTYQKGRTALAVGGIFVAILLIFVELGFFIAVPQGGLLIYDHMRFDLLVTSTRYVYQSESGTFARDRLAQVRASPEVAQASAVYIGGTKWQDPDRRQADRRLGHRFRPGLRIFTVPDILAQSARSRTRPTRCWSTARRVRSSARSIPAASSISTGTRSRSAGATRSAPGFSGLPSCWRARIRFSGFSAPARARDRATRSISGSSR